MTKKENTKLINILFDVYRKGVEGVECNLDDSLNKLLVAINYTRCCTELPNECGLLKNINGCDKGSGCRYPNCVQAITYNGMFKESLR